MEQKKFKCPVCGCEDYDFVNIEPVMLGGQNAIDYYVCCGCSIMFKNPLKFSIINNEEKR